MTREQPTGLTRNLAPVNVWALSFGCIIGYGAFTMPGSTFLPTAGPAGTAIALAIGACAILVIAACYRFLCSKFPDSGGSFAFTRNLLGYDHAFLCAWALVLAYLSLIWANATAFVAIGRYLLGSVFQVGFLYQVAGYDIYLGEVAVTIAVLCLFALLACGPKRILSSLNTLFAFVLLIGAAVCFAAVFGANGPSASNFAPAFAPGAEPGAEVFGIVALVPWAFMGFETVSHTAGECAFPARRLGGLMAVAVVSGLAVYLMMATMAVIGMPGEYGSWAAYVADLGNLDGIAAMPTLQAAGTFANGAGAQLLAVVVFAALTTSMLGFFRATSRLLYCMALDGILPDWFGQLNANHVPQNAILLIAFVSALIPFVGRAAIAWATDTTAISAAIAYGYTSFCTAKVARRDGRRGLVAVGIVGMAVSVLFLAFPLVPTLWSVTALSAESYLIVIAWAIVGLLFFRVVFRRDERGNFGSSPVVWMFMLFLVLFASTMWVRQEIDLATQHAVEDLNAHYVDEYAELGITLDEASEARERSYVTQEGTEMDSALRTSSYFQLALIAVSLVIMFSIYTLMLKRQREQEAQRVEAQRSSAAKTSFLSNMSHDIRTPMNAIVGYTQLAKRENVTLEEAREYLEKIDASSAYMLALINDVLEMSRIESGKLELEPVAVDLTAVMGEVRDLFATQMGEKGIDYTVDFGGVRDATVMCDKNRLDRMLLNLVSNAFKFTQSGGAVSVTLVQAGSAGVAGAGGSADAAGADAAGADAGADAGATFGSYEFRVKDTGIGMTPEFAKHVFDAFERERTSTVSGIEGTGLGMAITKSVVDAMGGTIDVVTEQGKGTEFIVRLKFEVVCADAAAPVDAAAPAQDASPLDFSGKRVLVVEDNEINREIAQFVLEDAGFEVELAENGKIGFDKVASSKPGHYDVVLTDVRMPVMDGREAARRIRALDDPALAGVPIVAAAANAFADEVQANFDAGMDAFVAKPLDVEELLATLANVMAARTRAHGADSGTSGTSTETPRALQT